MASWANAQVAIDKLTVNGQSTLLDFNDDINNTNVIILPIVDTVPTSLSNNNNGTFLLDASDKIVKVYEADEWKYLSDEGDTSMVVKNLSPSTNQGVIIGEKESSADGVVVLESPNKAMILPKVFRPHENVKSPYPGSMCYDTESKSLAIFDGKVWNYWK
ncbi:hypothetical protein GWI33_010834 [Rhynchophorus ferrugineus]|uniref:Uncharacterized protein n=1 Tax=Rhynchophorus ferrugineus TaxID=354439 RepID=A0A834IDR6_RHYFE|nr:hypothetical protein GWI33_010834 [Rhynchophorus ferrugineus]